MCGGQGRAGPGVEEVRVGLDQEWGRSRQDCVRDTVGQGRA